MPASALRFFGNHSLPYRAIPGVELTFEIWENASGKAQARQLGNQLGSCRMSGASWRRSVSLGFRGLGFGVLGFRVSGFRVWVFWGRTSNSEGESKGV